MMTTTEETRVALTDYLTEVCKLAEIFPGTAKPDGLDFEIYGRWAEVIRESDNDEDEDYPILMKVWANLWRVCRCHQLIVLKHDIDELGALISDKLRQRSDLEKREKALVNELGRLSYWERQEKRNEIKQQREEIGQQIKAISDWATLIQELQSRMRQRRDQLVIGLMQTRRRQKFSQTPNFSNVFVKGEQKLEQLVRAEKCYKKLPQDVQSYLAEVGLEQFHYSRTIYEMIPHEHVWLPMFHPDDAEYLRVITPKTPA